MKNLSSLDTNWETIDIKVSKGVISSCEDNVMDVLMNDSTYWSDVEEHLNCVDETENNFYEEPELSGDDYDCYYFDQYNEFQYDLMIENAQIIEDAMNQHMEKRNNNKFINNNKFKNKVRDKRILFKKGVRFILNAAYDRRGRKNTFDSSIVSMDLIETTQVQGFQEVLLYRQPFHGKTSFFGKNVIDSRFCNNQYLYERQSGSWYYHNKLRIKDQVDRFQCIKDIKEGVYVYEDKHNEVDRMNKVNEDGMLEEMEDAADHYVMELYFDQYEKYPYVVDAHIEPQQWWNEKHISMYKEYPNIHFDEDYDFDMEYEMSLFDDFEDQEDPYDCRFDDDLLDWDQD